MQPPQSLHLTRFFHYEAEAELLKLKEEIAKRENQPPRSLVAMKGTEKFWLEGGAEAILQVRAAYLSEDGRTERYWTRPRPYAPAVGSGRLGRAA